MNASMQMRITLEVKGVTLDLSLEEAIDLRRLLEQVVPPIHISDPLPIPVPYPAPAVPPIYPPSVTWSSSGISIRQQAARFAELYG